MQDFFELFIRLILVDFENMYFSLCVDVCAYCIIYNIVCICLYLSVKVILVLSLIVLIWLLRIVKVHLSSIQIVLYLLGIRFSFNGNAILCVSVNISMNLTYDLEDVFSFFNWIVKKIPK